MRPAMLYQKLPSIDSTPLAGRDRWLAPALLVAAGVSAAAIVLLAGLSLWSLLALLLAPAILAALYLKKADARSFESVPRQGADYALVGTALSLSDEPIALTDRDGSLLIANVAYREAFGTEVPRSLGIDEDSQRGLDLAHSMAWRDGAGCVTGIRTSGGVRPVEVDRGGATQDVLIWHFPKPAAPDALTTAVKRIDGEAGQRLAAAGIASAVVDAGGVILAANSLFNERAGEKGEGVRGRRLSDLIDVGSDHQMRFDADGENGPPVRAVHLPEGDGGAGTFLMFDPADEASVAQSSNLQALLDVMPIGLALVDRDGRFLTMNAAFRQAAGLGERPMPAYPGDLVVKEDKAAVADAVRRNARGPAMSGDLAVRLAQQTAEPVALTIAGLRGLGDAVVMLLLKDNSEEAKLKRQVAQATKMQVVGQLAGGVAHDFNNILTAIIGHCDLMLMRHTPGDSDYDDLQQIKSNSNRAAGLTRQLLAFSRQQTLRPQVLQLPDVVSEVSHLLKRLLGETVQLVVKHGRSLGSIRADPGQLEQVIINLAVNARDAMAPKGGGTVTIQTYAVRADQVAELGSDILPIAEYTALSVTDTGTGIPRNVLGKIFEPFFTTKEVGKGTGLGLSTVYGIVKQSGGFIFADSQPGEWTQFVIYLPVHRDEASATKNRRPVKTKKDELWGSGTVLLVEDEPMVRGVAERALTRHGYTVITADNGEDALEVVARNEPIDLLISDVVMPGMDGPTMVREARKSRPDLKILFMSGYAEEQLRKSIDIENVNFLPKPFSVTDLAEAARRAVMPK